MISLGVIEQQQNISLHISSVFKIEFITSLDFGLSFEEAYDRADTTAKPDIKFKVLSFDDLVESKLKSGRPKDYYDVLSLREVKNTRNQE